jgi:hypothetical protein
MNSRVRIIEGSANQVETKILSIQFNSAGDLKALFTPHLENIGFVLIENAIEVSLRNPSYREFFNDWVVRFSEKIKECSNDIIIEKFNREIKAIIQFGQKEKKLSMNSARGLYGEFLVLKSYLDNKIYPQYEILNGWHRPAPANHDFDYTDFSLEVKTVSRDSTTIKITSEHQLMSIEEKPIKLQLFRIENINKSNEDSLGILYNEIRAVLESRLVNTFEIKCAEDAFCEYLGPDYTALDYRFTVMEDFLYDVDQQTFPRIRKEKIDSGISNISFNIDISAIVDFKISQQ